MQCDAQCTEHQQMPMAALIQLSLKFCSSADRTRKFSSHVVVLRNLTVFLPVVPAASRLRQLQLHEGQIQKGIHADYQLVGQQTRTAAERSAGLLPRGSSMAFKEF
jgi:hypothetical protein